MVLRNRILIGERNIFTKAESAVIVRLDARPSLDPVTIPDFFTSPSLKRWEERKRFASSVFSNAIPSLVVP